MKGLLSLILIPFFLLWTASSFADQNSEEYQAWQRVEAKAIEALNNLDASYPQLNELEVEVSKWRRHWKSKLTRLDASEVSSVSSLAQKQLKSLGPQPDGAAKEAPDVAALRASLNEQILQNRAPFLQNLQARVAFASANTLARNLNKEIHARRLARLFEKIKIPFATPLIDALIQGQWPRLNFEAFDDGFSETRTIIKNIRVSEKFQENAILPLSFFAFFLVMGILQHSRFLHNIKTHRMLSKGFPTPWAMAALAGLGIIGILAYSSATNPMASALYYAALGYAAAWLIGDFARANDGQRLSQHWPMFRFWLTSLAAIFGTHLITKAFAHDAALSNDTYILLEFLPLMLGLYCLYALAAGLLKRGARKHQSVLIKRKDILIAQMLRIIIALVFLLIIFQRTNAAIEIVYALIPTLGLYYILKLLWTTISTSFTPKNADKPKTGFNALLPIFINAAIFILSLPVFALIWGARWSDIINAWNQIAGGVEIGGNLITPTNVAALIIIFIIGYGLIKAIQRGLRTVVLPKTGINAGLQNAFSVGFGYIGFFLAAVIALSTAGINLSSLAIVAGALSVGIGFGLQNIVSNFVSGIILLIERPITEGDWIEVGGRQGYVRNIAVRSTRIEAFDRSEFIIPNADLVSGVVTNYTRGNSFGRLIVPITVSADNDPRKITDILLEIGAGASHRLKSAEPSVVFKGFGECGLDFEIRIVLKDVNNILSVKSELNYAIFARLKADGINIPFPQREIWLHQLPPKRQPRDAQKNYLTPILDKAIVKRG